ncbi:MAG: hypothetical protein WCF18_26020, partial [Chthoniobacteraceae bacterium]
NKGFLALSIAEIAQADNKLKAVVKTLAAMVVQGLLMKAMFAGAFSSMSKSIRALVRDTGSLQAALDRLKTIQALQRSFAPFVGGIKAAKLKVAELVNFAARNNLKLEGVAQAERSLQDLTHGAFAGEEALQLLADAGAATGNTLEDAADGVGRFIADLREGKPIDDAAEGLRSMGLLSEGAARHLVELAQGGATTTEVLDALKATLAESKGALAGMQGELKAVEDRYNSAAQALKQKFGAPFTEAEIRNTKNWADVMTALAPAVERLAPFLEKITGGFATAASATAKWMAENETLVAILEALVKVGVVVVGAISAISAIGLAAWALGAIGAVDGLAASLIAFTGASGLAATGIGALGMAAKVALGATGLGLLLMVGVQLYGVYQNFANAAENAANALAEQRKAHDEVTAAMEKQIRTARNLQEAHEASAKAAKQTADAFKELQAAQAEQAKEHRAVTNPVSLAGIKHTLGNWMSGKSWDDTSEIDNKVSELADNLKGKIKNQKDAKAKEAGMGKGGGPQVDAVRRAAMDREVDMAKATISGNRERVVRLENLGDFANHYEQARKIYGDKGGKDAAMKMTDADIINKAAAPAVDSLARLGLGGEVGGGGDI